MTRRILLCVLGLMLAVPLPLQAGTASLQQVNWEGLSIVLGKQVAIAMPGGAVISGRANGIEPNALIVQVKKTTDSIAYPKGALRVPRETLRVLQVQTKGTKFRIIGTTLGAFVGLVAGALAAFAIQGGILSNNNSTGSAAAFIGITAGGTVLGYLAGNAGDKRSITIEIVP